MESVYIGKKISTMNVENVLDQNYCSPAEKKMVVKGATADCFYGHSNGEYNSSFL